MAKLSTLNPKHGRRPTDRLGGRGVLPFQQSKRAPSPSILPYQKKGRNVPGSGKW